MEAIERAKAASDCPLWRVSSTVFAHARSDAVLEPLPPFEGTPTAAHYKRTTAGDAVRAELQAIKLARSG